MESSDEEVMKSLVFLSSVKLFGALSSWSTLLPSIASGYDIRQMQVHHMSLLAWLYTSAQFKCPCIREEPLDY